MSYVELGSTIFRGTLRGANGTAQFKLTADAIHAVQPNHIGSGVLTYFASSLVDGVHVVSGGTANQLVVDVLDHGLILEILAAGHRCNKLTVDGVVHAPTGVRAPNNKLFPLVARVARPKGTSVVALQAGSSGTMNWSYIIVRYARNTGSGNQ